MSISKSLYRSYSDSFSGRLGPAVESAAKLEPFAARLKAAGLRADRIRTADDLTALPIQSKDDVVELQHASPPFGGMLSAEADVARVFQSPGPLYEPQLGGSDPWRWGPALKAAGFDRNDSVLNCFGYHLSPAGAMFDEASRALGARVLPGGIGSADLQARAIADLSITAYTGLPSYLKSLIDRYQELGLARERWHMTKAVVTAEPLPDSLRTELAHMVPTVLMAYGTAETGLLGYEDSPGAGFVVPDDVLIEVCDLLSGEPIAEGEGQIVVTLLRTDYPLIRFGTGDLSAWREGPDGRPRLAGFLGRVGQAVKVRGMFLHPAQANRAIGSTPGMEGFRFVVSREDHRDSLHCEITTVPGVVVDEVLQSVADRIRQELRFTCTVERVDSLPEGGDVITDLRDWS